MEFTVRRFDSMYKLLDQVESTRVPAETLTPYFYDRTSKCVYNAMSNVKDANYAGDMDLQSAINAARLGTWKADYAPEIRNVFDNIVPRLREALTFAFERRIDVTGDQVDVEAYVLGMPEQMHNWYPIEMQAKTGVVTLLLGISMRGCNICSAAACTASPDVTARDIFLRGQAVIGLLKALKLLGFELEVWTEQTVTRGWGQDALGHSILTRIQAAGATVDESALEFALGHPAWSRRLGFRVQENESKKIREAFGFQCGGYGLVSPPQHAAVVGANITLDLGENWFSDGRLYDQAVTPDIVLDWTLRQLVTCGVLSQEKSDAIRAEG